MDYTATWKTGFCGKADANKVAEEIQSIGESATPEQIVQKAKDKNSEMHQLFEWDNEKAGHEWRKQQARMIVANLVITENKPQKQETTTLRLFYQEEKGTGYKPLEVIFKNPDSYEKLKSSLKADLRSIQNKYKALSNEAELTALFAEIRRLTA